MRKGQQGPGVPWWAQIRVGTGWLGPGNTNVDRLGAWVGSTRYGTLPVLPSPHHPWYTHPPVTRTTPVTSTVGTCTYDRFRLVVGDPRGG